VLTTIIADFTIALMLAVAQQVIECAVCLGQWLAHAGREWCGARSMHMVNMQV
jgi:hypothetical protein